MPQLYSSKMGKQAKMQERRKRRMQLKTRTRKKVQPTSLRRHQLMVATTRRRLLLLNRQPLRVSRLLTRPCCLVAAPWAFSLTCSHLGLCCGYVVFRLYFSRTYSSAVLNVARSQRVLSVSQLGCLFALMCVTLFCGSLLSCIVPGEID